MINLPGPQQLDWILSDGTLFPHSFCLPPVAGGVSGGRLGDFHPVRQVTRFTRGVFTDTPALTMRIKKKKNIFVDQKILNIYRCIIKTAYDYTRQREGTERLNVATWLPA